jgi:hypothetical protein
MNRVAANLPARRSSLSEEITIEPDRLQTSIDDVGRVVRQPTTAGCTPSPESGRR